MSIDNKNPINIFKISKLYEYLELGGTVNYKNCKLELTDDGRIGILGTRYNSSTPDDIEEILLDCRYYTIKELQDIVDNFTVEEWLGDIVFTIAMNNIKG